MTELVCRECGEHFAPRSRFEQACIECGSEEVEPVDAYDPEEHELRCEWCGYEVDTTTRSDEGWDPSDTPRSVDDPCPLCGSALVPASARTDPRALPESKMARGAALKLHRNHSIPGPPYELKGLAESLGLTVVTGNFDHDGMLVNDVIEIPERVASVVQRFVLAHEIGHHVLRHDGERRKVEPEANAFASELLIPRDELVKRTKSTPSIRALSGTFGVSRQAMAYAVMTAGVLGSVRP